LLGALAAALAAGSTTKAAGLESVLFTDKRAHIEMHHFGTLRTYYSGPTEGSKNLEIGSLTLQPSAEPHPPHTHPDEEILIVTEGEGEITMNGKPMKIDASKILYVAPNYLHGIRNTGSKPLTFYFIKWVGK